MTDFIGLVNRGLQGVNETPLNSGGFASPRGLQNMAKSSINRAYFDIAIESTEWPWLNDTVTRVEGTEILTTVAGVQWYDLAATVIDADWRTFYITDKDPAVVSTSEPDVSHNLIYLNYDLWAQRHRPEDNKRTVESRDTPKYVIRHPDGKIGISPVPDIVYYIEYFSWNTATLLTLETDTLPFPEEYEGVLDARVLYYLWTFKENTDLARLALSDYTRLLRKMKLGMLSTKMERMRAI